MDTTFEQVEGILQEAASTLRTSFAAYWPTFGDTGAHERNLSLHVAAAFLRAGFAVFGEAHREGGAVPRYDVLAYSKASDVFVAAECKHLWKSSVADGMRTDVARLRQFEPVRRRHTSSPSTVRLGLIAAFCEDDDRFRQLVRGDSSGPCVATRGLLTAIPGNRGWKSHLVSEHGRHPDRPGRLHFLYSLFLLHGPEAAPSETTAHET